MVAQHLEQLSDELERGKSDKLLRFLDAMAKFHRYSWCNTMLILQQCPHATRVAGYRAWNRFNRQVRRGERSITILAPIVRGTNRDASAKDEHDDRDVLGFRAVRVFDVSQTDGEPLPEPASVAGDPGSCLDRLHGFAHKRHIRVSFSGHLGTASGVSHGGRIEIASGLLPAAEFEVLAHELAHELLHHQKGRTTASRLRELEAEAVAYAVCSAVGLDTGSACSDYILSHRGDRQTLAESLGRVQRVAAELVSHILTADLVTGCA